MLTFIPEQLIEPLQLYKHAMSIYPNFNSELFQSRFSEILEMIIKHKYGLMRTPQLQPHANWLRMTSELPRWKVNVDPEKEKKYFNQK